MKTLLKIVLALILAAWILGFFVWSIAQAETRLNAVTGAAETVPNDGREWTTQLNPVTGEASVQPAGAGVELNAVTGEAEWDSGHNNPGSEDGA